MGFENLTDEIIQRALGNMLSDSRPAEDGFETGSNFKGADFTSLKSKGISTLETGLDKKLEDLQRKTEMELAAVQLARENPNLSKELAMELATQAGGYEAAKDIAKTRNDEIQKEKDEFAKKAGEAMATLTNMMVPKGVMSGGVGETFEPTPAMTMNLSPTSTPSSGILPRNSTPDLPA